jgi:hypothetical protein
MCPVFSSAFKDSRPPEAGKETLHSSRALFSPIDLGLLAAYCTLTAWMGYTLGQDLNWDLLNYHYYNPYQLLGGRLDRDIHAAGVQSFHNPLLDLPFYAAVRVGVPPLAFFITLSAFHGLVLWAVHRITMLLVPPPMSAFAHPAGIVAAVTAAAGAGFYSEVGSTMADDTLAVPLLISLLLLLRSVEDADRGPAAANHEVLVAGVLAGAAIGSKLAVGPIGIGLGAAALALPGSAPARSSRIVRFASGGLIGVAATAGYWMWLMGGHFGSPVFPYFNTLFQSPFAPPISLADGRFFPSTPLQRLFYPFFWMGTQNLVIEPAFRDARLAAAFLAVAALALLAALERGQPGSAAGGAQSVRLRALAIWFAVSYAIWLPLFSYYRYVIPLETMSGALVIGSAVALARRWTGAAAIALPVCIALAVSSRPPDWGRRPWSDSYFGVDATALAKFEDATIFMWDMPQAYLVPHFPASTTFLRLLSNKGLVPGNAMWDRLERHAAAAPSDRLFLMDLEPGSIHEQQGPVLARFGLVLTEACERFDSFAGSFRLCRVERAAPPSVLEPLAARYRR